MKELIKKTSNPIAEMIVFRKKFGSLAFKSF